MSRLHLNDINYDLNDIYYDLDDIDSELGDMIKSLNFRNRQDRKGFRIYDDELPTRSKRNYRNSRTDDIEIY